jgi:signal peptidase I
MQPTYLDGEWVVIEKKSGLPKGWEPDRLDVVVILDEESGDRLTKRVIGLEGDTIEIKKGVVYLNDKKFEEPYGRGKILIYLVDENDNNLRYWEGAQEGEPVVELINEKAKEIPKGNVWVIGDNREASWYGTLPVKKIRGLVVF